MHTLKKFLIILSFFACTAQLVYSSRNFMLTPANAIEFFFKNMKNLQFANLLPYTMGPERKRMERAARLLQHNRVAYWDYKNHMDSIIAHRTTRIDEYEDVAAVDFSWTVVRIMPSRESGNMHVRQNTEKPLTMLLIKTNNLWYIADTRSNDNAMERELNTHFSNMEHAGDKKKARAQDGGK